MVNNRAKARPLKKQAVLESLGNGCSLEEAAKAAGTCRRTIGRWVERDSKFAKAILAFRQTAIEVVYNAMFRAAAGYRYAERKVVQEYVYEEGFSKTGRHGKPLIKRNRSRTTKETHPSVPAADLWLRNHDKGYIQRQPEVAVGIDRAELKRTLNEDASAYPETETKEGKEDE